MFKDNKNFYPTPDDLIFKMLVKVSKIHERTYSIFSKDTFTCRTFKSGIENILEPSAGKGDIVNYINKHYSYSGVNIDCIEQDQNLVDMLVGSNKNVVDYDFLSFNSSKFYDCIIMNPPFDEGAKHLLKAINIMYNGHIVCLLNAETILNPYSNERKLLVELLDKHNADIEYIENAFTDAERKTGVKIALIHVEIKNSLESDLFDNIPETEAETIKEEIKEDKDVSFKTNQYESLVRSYNATIESGKSCIIDYYTKHHKNIGGMINLSIEGYEKSNSESLDDTMKQQFNMFLKNTKNHYWDKVTYLPDVTDRLSNTLRQIIFKKLSTNHGMEFTEANIRTMIMNLVNNYGNYLISDAERLFDTLTREYAWTEETKKNRLHFDCWKTNSSFKINKTIIIPMGQSAFINEYGGNWRLDYRPKSELNDIDNILNYITHHDDELIRLADVIEQSFKDGKTKGLESTFFTNVKCYKKGTIHLTFKDDDVLRKFNIIACKQKGWLPNEYGYQPYESTDAKTKELIKSFEGETTYKDNYNKGNYPQFAPNKNLLRLT